ncbi:glycosyltransferase [Flavobacterium columnare]|uniref:Glycosyltransferase family 4 protein n=1 Tax=Flavobacterium columnare TaxID=996 RepID=A0AAI8CJF6_9FLAO|nr:glycosyltransferase [Flavobacterium columnare]AMO21161.1 glycosyltransferase family 4 protein [Flavobacterium columnare]AUX19182.1 hypothetical protein AQ623_13475 [Flavobacterium columnare]QOG58259.1 glycosyltransferase [Flavobacterium columnare]QOG60982.1 glycosyltransferase [Flavobacterium columnare]QOG63702.1 glycosyltransferase [Flavobacterium columnare]
MKIALVITDYGSFNNFLGEVARDFVLNNNEVFVICDRKKVINYEDRFPYEELGIRFHFVNFSRNFSIISKIKTSCEIKEILNIIKPDLVNLHFTSGIFVSLLTGRIKFKTIGVFHGLGFPVIKNTLKRLIFKRVEFFCFNRLDQIGLINDFDYQLVKKYYPEKTFKYKSFGVGCDLDKFDKQKFSLDNIAQIKADLNISNSSFLIMYTGRFVYFKGFDLVVKAMKYIEEELGEDTIKLVLVGGKDDAHVTGLTPKEEAYLQSTENIINIGFTSEVEKYLAIADLFVFPSSKEGMPVCIMEATAMGVPVITLDSRGCNDVIKNNFNGVLLNEICSHIDLAKVILDLQLNHDKLDIFSKNALNFREKLDRKNFISESISIFKENIL